MMSRHTSTRSIVTGILRSGAAVLLATLLPACSDDPTRPADASRTTVKGITLVEWTRDGYTTPTSLTQVVNIAATGANTLTVLVTAYQPTARSATVSTHPTLTPSELSVGQVVVQALSQGMITSTAIKLHVDLDDGTWRGNISPPDPLLWFQSYSVFVMQWATFAETNGMQTLVVGTELAGTLKHDGLWRALIASVRGVFTGELVYAASWDEAPLVPFWGVLDLVGVNFYAPVAFRPNTHRFEILRGWQPWLDRIRLLHKLADKDILLTEIGYRSVDGAGMHPYDFTRNAAVDLQEQGDLYWAALEAVGNKPWIRGVYWWNWPANPTGAEQTDYTPQGKPAEKELSDAWGP